MRPDAIVVDAGSTDAGPHKLGAGVAIVSRFACAKDLTPMLRSGLAARIPVIIGSAGGSGGRVHVEWTLKIIEEITRAEGLRPFKLAVVWADIPHDEVARALNAGDIQPLGQSVPDLTPERTGRDHRDRGAGWGMSPSCRPLKPART